MLLKIPGVLSKGQVAECRKALASSQWIDGYATAGHQSRISKNNEQLAETDPTAIAVGDLIMGELERDPLFVSAALPRRIFPPLFNRYSGGQNFGTHIDNAIRQVAGSIHRVRTDLSATLFLTEPDEYDGGELVIEDTYGVQEIKLPAGDMILYPATSIHHVEPVTRDERLASFFWIESMVRDNGQRTLLFDLDTSIQEIARDSPNSLVSVRLTGIYHNLLRRWADV